MVGPWVLHKKYKVRGFSLNYKHVFSFEDTLGSLVYPPAAMEDGWNFFSITGILIVLLYLLSCRARTGDGGRVVDSQGNQRAPPGTRELWVKLFFIIWISVMEF